MKISPLQPRDYPQVLALLDQEKPLPYLPDAFSPLWSVMPDGVPKALWAITLAGELIGGAGYVVAETDRKLGWMGVIITPAWRQRGIGQQVCAALLVALQKRGVIRVLTKIYAHQADGLRFLVRHGFCPSGRSILSQLDLHRAQLAQWTNPDDLVAEQGLGFVRLDRLPRRGMAERLLPIWNRTRPDQPQDWPYTPYTISRFEHEILEPDELALNHSYAIITPDQQVVALTLNIFYPGQGEGGTLFTVYSAVDPDFRRRKLATALKLKVIAQAQAHGIAFLTTENDERNQAMWQINQRLGYRRLADLLVYGKSF